MDVNLESLTHGDNKSMRQKENYYKETMILLSFRMENFTGAIFSSSFTMFSSDV